VAKRKQPRGPQKGKTTGKLEKNLNETGEEALLDFQQTVGANVEMKLLAKELEYLVGTGAAVTTKKEVRDFVSLGRQVMDDLQKLVE
jgi:hypothetical protein